MRCDVLGRTVLTVDGTEVALPRATPRAVLAVLTIADGSIVSVDELIAAIWGEPPESPRKATHVAVSRLRSSLGPAADQLESLGGGYTLHIEPGQCDARQAAASLAQARNASRCGEADRAVALTRIALGLWRDLPLVDLDDAPFVAKARLRLRDLRLALVEVRNEGLLVTGRHPEVLDDIDAAIESDPLRERLYAHKMVALHACGRQADAIAAYESLRGILRRRFGIDPVDEVDAIYRAILDHRRVHIDVANSSLTPTYDDRRSLFTELAETIDALTESDDTRAQLLLRLARMQYEAGERRWRGTANLAVRTAAKTTLPALLIEAAQLGHHGWTADPERIDGSRVAFLRDAVHAIDAAERIPVLVALAAELAFSAPLADRVALCDEALTEARAAGNEDVILEVLTGSFHGLWAPDTLERRLADSAEAVRIASSGPSLARGFAAGSRMAALLECGDLAGADQCRAEFRDASRRAASPVLEWGVPLHGCWRAVIDGDLDCAEKLCFEALGAGERAGRPEARTVFTMQLAAIRWAQGCLGEAAEFVREMVDSAPKLEALRPWLARMSCDIGDDVTAAALLEQDCATDLERIGTHQMRLAALVLYTEVARLLDHGDAAAVLRRHLEPYADQFVFTGGAVYGPVHHALGQLALVEGDSARATREFEAARTLATAMPSPFFAARASRELELLQL